ncbi:MAG: histidine--tRNA ligase [Gammaproteobacteria bacterium]|nr:histidine--tRNA ligase [Gammaproteobacteria bacterium]
MSKGIQPIRGMNDILPGQSGRWQHLEAIVREIRGAYGYRESRVPVVERTELFKRSIGEVTDIVEKEMYTFDDRGGESITLRPEATAGIVRAGISNGMLYNQRQRLWCTGPMFRYERPQKGRYRQFHQIDVEALGFPGPDVDAEIILLSARLWKRLGLKHIKLELNSLGTSESRAVYRELLVGYFREHYGQLDEDSQRRLEGNPLRILDSKNPDMQGLIAGAPLLADHLDEESAQHFSRLRRILDDAGIEYSVNPRLVRGLDYYSRTVFEWVTDQLGAQGAVCSGGRYDGLVEQLGGPATPAIGWALGVERLLALMESQDYPFPADHPQVYMVMAGEAAETAGLGLAEALRDELAGLRLEVNCGGGSFKAQLKKADRSGAEVAVIIGENEVERQVAALKPLRGDGEQQEVTWGDLAGRLRGFIEPGAGG